MTSIVQAGWVPSGWITNNWYPQDWFTEYGTSSSPTPLSASTSSRLREIIRNFEKQNPTKTVFTVGTAEPGLDNYECRLRTIIKNLEK